MVEKPIMKSKNLENKEKLRKMAKVVRTTLVRIKALVKKVKVIPKPVMMTKKVVNGGMRMSRPKLKKKFLKKSTRC